MSREIQIDLRVPLDRFDLALVWETDETFLGLFGPSGAGKTTVLEALAGLCPQARGVIRVGGKVWLDSSRGIALRPDERGVGYVPQDALLFPHLDVLGNLRIGRNRAGRGPKKDRLAPERVLEVLELSGLEGRSVASLSGGEKRRVALARALLSGPDLLLLDEPLAGLDAQLRDRVITYLLRVREEFRLPTILVSHDVLETKLFASEVAVLSSGRLSARGSPEEVFLRPGMDGFENVLRGVVRGVDRGAARVALGGGVEIVTPAHDLSRGAEVRIGLHAEDLMLAVETPSRLSAQNVVAGRIRDLWEEAGTVLVVVEVGERQVPLAAAITPLAQEHLALVPGMAVVLVWKAHACRVWAAK